ncbi:MAG: DUF4404 family protein [Gammaproteobacteria bacterium]|nr:DUF4404 family protein [Gammaproteobacteria bacterium]
MPKQHIEGLISELHDRFADSDTSPQQEAMLAQMKSELAEWKGPKPSEDFRTTAERLLQEMEEDHPRTAAVIHEIINTLNNIGV